MRRQYSASGDLRRAEILHADTFAGYTQLEQRKGMSNAVLTDWSSLFVQISHVRASGSKAYRAPENTRSKAFES